MLIVKPPAQCAANVKQLFFEAVCKCGYVELLQSLTFNVSINRKKFSTVHQICVCVLKKINMGEQHVHRNKVQKRCELKSRVNLTTLE